MKRLSLVLLASMAGGCATASPPAAAPRADSTPPAEPSSAGSPRLAALHDELRAVIRQHGADTVVVAVALRDLATGDSLLLDAHTPLHAASTMKVPVMLQLFRLADEGVLSLEDSLPLRNEFISIADGSRYTLSASADSDTAIYARLGQKATVRELIDRMITRSGNLATNLLIDLAQPRRIAATLAGLGAGEMRVLRGVEDGPAYRAGLNNTTTAYGLMKTLEAIAAGRAASPAATQEMLEILARQEFRDLIPAGLPASVRVANKTGWIPGIHHDGAVVFPEGRAPYVLVVLTRGFQQTPAAQQTARAISARVYAALTARRDG